MKKLLKQILSIQKLFVSLQSNSVLQASLQCSNRRTVLFSDTMNDLDSVQKQPFQKEIKLPSEQIGNLKNRGLIITDEEKAIDYLSNIGYFRLSAYFYPLLAEPKSDHIFKSDSNFETALNMYKFDRKLRVMIFNEIEKIEVAFRAHVTDIISREFNDIFWITNPQYFDNKERFKQTLKRINNEVEKSSEEFVTHFKNKYTDPYPPAWIIVEVLPLGTLCKIFTNLKDHAVRKKVAQRFGIQQEVFHSWILTIAGLRNMCCHHSRIWNKKLNIHPIVPKKTRFSFVENTSDLGRIYCRLCIVKYLISSIAPNNKFTSKLKGLLKHYSNIDINAMGFPTDWERESLWQ